MSVFGDRGVSEEDVRYYLGNIPDSFPVTMIDDLFRERGWGVMGTDEISDTAELMKRRAVPTLEERWRCLREAG